MTDKRQMTVSSLQVKVSPNGKIVYFFGSQWHVKQLWNEEGRRCMPHPVWATACSALLAFLGASADELLILVAFFARAASAGGSTLTHSDIVLGYALGSASVLALSSLGFAGALLPPRYVCLVGLLPLLLGLRKLCRRALKARARRAKAAAAELSPSEPAASEPAEALLAGEAPCPEAPAPAPVSGLQAALAQCLRVGVAEVLAATLAGGSEEVSLYMPLLAAEAGAAGNALAALAAIAAASALWLALARALVQLPPVARAIERVGDAAEPWLMIGIGLWCLVGSVIIPVQWGA